MSSNLFVPKKLLLDECVNPDYASSFPDDFRISSVRDEDWLETPNGRLLPKAAARGFEAIITYDRGFHRQQKDLMNLPIPIVIMRLEEETAAFFIPAIIDICARFREGVSNIVYVTGPLANLLQMRRRDQQNYYDEQLFELVPEGYGEIKP